MHDALRENGVGGPESWEALKSRFLELVDDQVGEGAEESGLVRELIIADREAGKFLGAVDDGPGEAPVFEATLAAGEEFASCRVVRLAGRGGMGEVYEAEDLGVDVGREGATVGGGRRVALKLLPGSAADRRRHAALRRDAAALARLTHPGIARVYRAGFASLPGSAEAPRPYMVMEFIDGEPVEAYVARMERMERAGRRRPALALEIGLALCEAMAYSHREGVVHRDLKSSNVLVRADGTLSVVDFGIARLSEGGDASGRSTATMDLAGVGSLTSISPERARGVDSGAREDVWAIGALLFTIAMGRPARELGDAPVFEALQVIGREPPARADGGAIGRDLATVIDRCLAFDPVDRYGDAGEALAELRRVRDGLAPRARAIGPAGRTWRWAKRHRAAAWGLSAVMAVLLVSSAALAVFAANAASARRLADERRRVSETVANGLLFEVSEALVGVPGASAAQERLLEIGLEYAEAAMSREGELDGASRLSLARALMALGQARHVRGVAGEGAARSAEAFRRAKEMALGVAEERAEGSMEQAEALGIAAWAARLEAFTTDSSSVDGADDATIALPVSLAERALEIDGEQREALLTLAYMRIWHGDIARRSGDWEAGISSCREAIALVERALAAEPHDAETLTMRAYAWSALTQRLCWARMAGHPVETLADAERALVYADEAAAVNPALQMRTRAGSARLIVARAMRLERPDLAVQAGEKLLEAVAHMEAAAAMDPENTLLARDLSAGCGIAGEEFEALAGIAESAEQRAAWLREAIRLTERGLDLAVERSERGLGLWQERAILERARASLVRMRAQLGDGGAVGP